MIANLFRISVSEDSDFSLYGINVFHLAAGTWSSRFRPRCTRPPKPWRRKAGRPTAYHCARSRSIRAAHESAPNASSGCADYVHRSAVAPDRRGQHAERSRVACVAQAQRVDFAGGRLRNSPRPSCFRPVADRLIGACLPSAQGLWVVHFHPSSCCAQPAPDCGTWCRFRRLRRSVLMRFMEDGAARRWMARRVTGATRDWHLVVFWLSIHLDPIMHLTVRLLYWDVSY